MRRFACLISLLALVGCSHNSVPNFVGSGGHLQRIDERAGHGQSALALVKPANDESKTYIKFVTDDLMAIKAEVKEETAEKAAANETIKNLRDDNTRKDERIAEYQERWTGDKLQHLIRMVLFGVAGVLVTFLVGWIVMKFIRKSPVGIAEDAVGAVSHVVSAHMVSNKEEKFFRDA